MKQYRVIQVIEELLEFVNEAHKNELERQHYGDKTNSCSYCRSIRDAKELVEELRNEV